MPAKTKEPEAETMDVWGLECNNCFAKVIREAVGEPGDKNFQPEKKEYWRIVRFDKPETILRNNAVAGSGLVPYRVTQGEVVPIHATRVMIEPSGDIILEKYHKDEKRREQVSMKAEQLWAWANKNGLSLVLDADGEPYRYDYNNYHETVEGKMERAKRIKPIWEA